MQNTTPEITLCPLCLSAQGKESDETMVLQDDIFYRDNFVSAAINSKFIGNNPGHVIIFPNAHHENANELSEAENESMTKVTRSIAIALKELRKCDGISIQPSEKPEDGVPALHYQIHLFPRYNGDRLLENMKNIRIALPSERLEYANELIEYFEKNTN